MLCWSKSLVYTFILAESGSPIFLRISYHLFYLSRRNPDPIFRLAVSHSGYEEEEDVVEEDEEDKDEEEEEEEE